jgi:hypothetical protein
MTDIICINDVFLPEVLAFYQKFGITTPQKDKMYSVREMKKHTTGDTGLLLNEIKNPDVPVKHPVMGEVWFEPTWSIKRFATLAGDVVKKEEVEEVNV